MRKLAPLLGRLQTPILLIALVLVATLIGSAGNVTISGVAIVAIISVVFVVGLSVFAGNSGIMSFGHVAFMAIGAYATAYLTIPPPLKKTLFANLPGWLSWLADIHSSFPVALVLSGLAAAVFGLATSPIVARLSGLQSGIATLALLLIVYNILNSWTDVTRGSSSMIGIPRNTTVWISFGVAAAAIVIAWAYRQSRSGLQLRATRDDTWAAQATGIDVGRHRALSWVLSASLCGLAGSLYAGYLISFNVSSFFLSATFGFVVMIVLGGYLSLSGAVIGALGVSLLQELLRRLQDGQFTGGHALPAGSADLLLAATLLIVLIKAPYGLMGTRELSLSGLLRRRRPAAAEATDEVPPDSGSQKLHV